MTVLGPAWVVGVTVLVFGVAVFVALAWVAQRY
jgi:hypothetical protein